MKEKFGIVTKISGPLIIAKEMTNVHVYDVVLVGKNHLLGEIIEIRDDRASIQVYEDTSGIGAGDKVFLTGENLSVELGPGLLSNIYDGIQRPLDRIYESYGDSIPLGIEIPKLDRNKKWIFNPLVKINTFVKCGAIIGYVQETTSIVHKIMIPPHISGVITYIYSGEATISDIIARVSNGEVTHDITMLQKWAVRKKRPYITKITPYKPMHTGIRVIDAFFPIAMGGIAAIPGPFGSGKTVVQQLLAKYADADIFVYVGCGERGNEMTDVLLEFPTLLDAKTGDSLMNRTILIANTSNMPVAAREASIYTGVTIAEYFRDMGYRVALMADSTSRWAEALREMSSRLEEMPGEEGYPAYLSSRLAEFYERAGYVKNLSGLEGSITIIGAVSPPGGDTSEPVSQATLRIVKVFWSLNANLAYKRHFPAIDWLRSYSLYSDVIHEYIVNNIEPNWTNNVVTMLDLLQEEQSLLEIVKIVGADSLDYNDRAKLKVAQMIREDFLSQDAFHSIDAFTSLHKQYLLSSLILSYYEQLKLGISANKNYDKMDSLNILERIARFKNISEEQVDFEYEKVLKAIIKAFSQLEEGE